jgi:hypothetical protein
VDGRARRRVWRDDSQRDDRLGDDGQPEADDSSDQKASPQDVTDR